MKYIVDVALNGQQFTGKPLNFTYYDIQIQELVPDNAMPDQKTEESTIPIIVRGKGLFESKWAASKIFIDSLKIEK